MTRSRWLYPTLVALLLAGCEGSSLTGAAGLCIRPFFAVALDPAGKALLYTSSYTEHRPSAALPAMRRVPLGGTPVSVALRADGRRAVVPLGEAGYAAVVNLETGTVERELRFATGSADAAAWVGDDVVLVANRAGGYVGRFQLRGAASQPGQTVTVAPQPVQLLVDGEDVLVLSVNSPVPGQGGRVTALDPQSLRVKWVTPTWGTNPVEMSVQEGMLYVLNRNGYPLQPNGGFGPSVIIVLNRDTREPLRGFQAGQGATSLNVYGLIGFVSGPTQGTTIRYMLDQNDYGPLQFFCARDASGACRNVGTAWGYDYEEVFQTVVDRPWIYRFVIDRRPDGPVHVLADSIALPAGSTGASHLKTYDIRRPCEDVIIVEG